MRTIRLTREHVDALIEFVIAHDADEVRLYRPDADDPVLTLPEWEDDDQWLTPIMVGLSRESDAHFDAVAEITNAGAISESVTTG